MPIPHHQLFQIRRMFGEYFRQLRTEKDFPNRAEFAKTARVNTQLIADIELGRETKSATIAIMNKLAEALSCEFVLGDPDKELNCGATTTLEELFRMGVSPSFVDR